MKVLLFQEDERVFEKSGIGRAMKHQKKALELANVDYTLNKHDDFDIIHLNTINPQSYILAKKAKKMGKKVVFHGHSTEEDFQNSFAFSNLIAPAFKKWLEECYSTADVLLTPTPYSKSILEKYNLGVPIIPISNGIDLDNFKKDEQKIKTFKNHFKLTEKDKVIISVGHYFERKGLPDFCEVATKFPEVTFIWFGYTAPALLTEKIKQAIKHKPSNVILPGYIDGDIIQGAFASADLFFFPSYEETEGIVVLEALASQCQVLVRDIGVYSGWLEKNKNCFMADDNISFEKYIRDYFDGTISSTVDLGLELAKTKSLEKIGIQLKEIYTNLLLEK